jgi:hypothetical protein
MLVHVMAWTFAICSVALVSAAELKSAALEADEDANTAHISPLHEGDPDEVRYWVSGTIVTVDRTGIPTNGFGTLVRATGITQCKMVVEDLVKPSQGRRPTPCETIENPSRARRILSYLPEISRGDLKECQILDGDEWIIDGVYKGHRFTFRIDNPQFCNEVVKDMTAYTDNNEWRAP